MLSLEKIFLGWAWGSWAAQHPPEYFAKGSGWRARHMYSAVQSGRPWATKPAVQTLHLRLQDPGPASGVALSLGARRGHPGLQRPSLL